MCGIAGIIDFNKPEPKEALLRRMLGLIRHRGPDAFGIYMENHAGLAHARLSIIDLSGGDQPIHNEDKTIWVIYNGEIFNYPELRQDLEKRGHKFYTKTDTEILVHLYEDRGAELFKELNGQFAFALWDKKRASLLLGRDRLGIRPLFYYLKDGRLLFASEIKAIFADSKVPREVDLQTMSDIFTSWTSLGSDTPFKHIRQLLPGNFASFSSKGLVTRPYWQLSFSRSIDRNRSLESWTEEINHLLYDATRIRLRADVPVGAYLSGGLDSTYTTSLVKRYFNNQLCTFSVSFADDRFDEAFFQEKAVRALRTEHRRIRCTEKDIGRNFPKVIWHTETPLLRTGPVPLFQLSQLVRETNFKVVLTGEGSDEIFAGYDIFKEDRIRRFWARCPDSKMRPKLLQKLYPDIFTDGNTRAGAFLMGFFRKGLTQVDSVAYSHKIRWENTSQIKSFFSHDVQDLMKKNDGFEERFLSVLPPDFLSWDPLSRAQYTEILIFLTNYLLSSQGDRVAMGHAVEGRFPFLDYRVVEFACNVPPRYRLNGLKDKFILRKAAKDLIPAELALRPKQPYRAPISRCFLGDEPEEYVMDLLSEKAVRQNGYFDPERVNWLIEKCRKQEGKLLSERENMALVGVLSTQLLHHHFISTFPPYPIQEPENLAVFTTES
ncbi:MAG: asparagine synthase (glutamine-hydrolyzing) [Deltaproteobacteria bacterium]|nr:asparagine synthase (glutamine-hydrolyzing) [Deltaproteobacteria bacterium]